MYSDPCDHKKSGQKLLNFVLCFTGSTDVQKNVQDPGGFPSKIDVSSHERGAYHQPTWKTTMRGYMGKES